MRQRKSVVRWRFLHEWFRFLIFQTLRLLGTVYLNPTLPWLVVCLLGIAHSYSTAINKLSEKQFTLSRSVLRLKRIEEELKEHLTALQHEWSLIKQCVFFPLPPFSFPNLYPSKLEQSSDPRLPFLRI